MWATARPLDGGRKLKHIGRTQGMQTEQTSRLRFDVLDAHDEVTRLHELEHPTLGRLHGLRRFFRSETFTRLSDVASW
jgi:hypothetical protein